MTRTLTFALALTLLASPALAQHRNEQDLAPPPPGTIAVPPTAGHTAPPARTAAPPSSATPPVPAPQPVRLFDTPPTVDHLPNGLTVVTLPWPTPGIVAYFTVMRVGSRDETEAGHTGFAHLFEHMMFRGSQAYPQARREAMLQAIGVDDNAFTTNDYTCYTVITPASHLAEVIDLESDRFQHLFYDEQAFRTETGAVLGEYNKNASSPELIMDETMSGLAFTRHTYRHTTIGFLADVQAMPGYFQFSQQFFHRFYTPDDATIVAVGDVDHDALLALVRDKYGAWTGHRAEPRIPAEPEPHAGGRRDLPWAAATPPRMWIGYRAPAFDAANARQRAQALRDTAALQVVHALVFSTSSPLYQRLVVDEQKLLDLSSWAGQFTRDPGLFSIDATLAPDAAFDPMIDAIQHELDEVAAGHTPPERIADVMSHLRYALPMGLETPEDVASLLASVIAVSGDVTRLDDYLAALAAVTPADVQRVAQRYLTASRRFVVTLAHHDAPQPATPAAAPAGGAQ